MGQTHELNGAGAAGPSIRLSCLRPRPAAYLTESLSFDVEYVPLAIREDTFKKNTNFNLYKRTVVPIL